MLFMFAFLSLFMMSFVVVGTRRFRDVTSALQDYENYNAEFQQRWGPRQNSLSPTSPTTK
jgi:hypothetical protein